MQAMVLRSMDEVRRLVPEWRGLPLDNPFASWDFARDWLSRPEIRPFVVTVRDDDERLVGLASWCLRMQPGGIRLLEGIRGYDAWIHDPWILAPELARPVSDALVTALLERREDWDALDLILSGERSPRLIERLESWGSARRPSDRQHRVADLSRGWESYWSSRSKGLRSSMRQAQRRLDAWPHRMLEAESDDYQRLLETGIRFSQARWDPERNRDHWYDGLRDLAHASAPRGAFSAFGIELDGRIIAVSLVFHAGSRAYGTLQGYDPAYAELRVGSLLSVKVFERLAARGTRWIEMGDGLMEWKERMKTQDAETVLIQVGNSLPGKALLSWKYRIKPQLANWLAPSAASR